MADARRAPEVPLIGHRESQSDAAAEGRSPVLHDPKAARSSRNNFLRMSLLTVIATAAAEIPMGFAAVILEPAVGRIGTAVLFLCMVFSSFLVAPVVVAKLGSKTALVCGVALQSLYIIGFAIASFLPKGGSDQTFVFICSSAFSGIGAGVLWTAQGAFFVDSSATVAIHDHKTESDDLFLPTKCSSGSRQSLVRAGTMPLLVKSRKKRNHAVIQPGFAVALAEYRGEMSDHGKEVTSELASTWASLFLAMDLAMKLLCTLTQGVLCAVPLKHVFVLLASLSTLSTLGLLLFVNAPERRPKAQAQDLSKRMEAAVKLWKRSAVWLLAPMNVAFGLSGGLINGVVNPRFVVHNPCYGKASLGALMAGTSIVAMFGSMLQKPLAAKFGLGAGFVVGGVAFGTLSFLVIFFTPSEANNFWGYGLIVLYVLHGTGRSIYESSVRSVFAEVFVGEAVGAFANCLLQTGLAFFACFTLQTSLPPQDVMPVLAGGVLAMAVAVVPCYRLATRSGRSRGGGQHKLEAARGNSMESMESRDSEDNMGVANTDPTGKSGRPPLNTWPAATPKGLAGRLEGLSESKVEGFD